MVVGERFAWAHLPKTGGDTTRALFGLFPGLVLFADSGDTNEKHAIFRDREQLVRGKLLAMNIRRLPAWVLSRAHHVAREGVWPHYKPLSMDSAAKLAGSSLPDVRLSYFTSGRWVSMDRWLRLEHLREDFLDFASEITDVDPRRAKEVRELPALDVAEYDREPRNWFSERQLEQLYRRNPLWAALERELYGGLLDSSAGPSIRSARVDP